MQSVGIFIHNFLVFKQLFIGGLPTYLIEIVLIFLGYLSAKAERTCWMLFDTGYCQKPGIDGIRWETAGYARKTGA